MTKTESCLKDLPTLSPGLKRALSKVSLAYYAEESITLETGVKFSFRNHEYLYDIFNETHPYLVIQKGTQMGLTTFAFIKSLWGCQNFFPLGVIYFFPTQGDVFDFSKARITPFLNYNKSLNLQDEKGVDNVGLKKVGKAFIYFRGMKSTLAMKSVPADCLIFDEVDEAEPSAKEIALKRIDHSDFKWIIELSNPTIENYGINKVFQESDQRYWYYKCEHCNSWTSLDKDFPNCLRENEDGSVARICMKCKKEITLDNKAEWIAEYPTRFEKRGYFVSQLYSRYISPKTILREFKTKKGYELESFYRLRLGRAYTLAQNRIAKQEVLDLESSEPIKYKDEPCFMGVDCGKDLHVVLIRRLGTKIAIQDLPIMTRFEDLDGILNFYKVRACVIDALPETRKAKEFRDRNRGKVFINYYNDNQKGDYKFNEEIFESQVNRTESLDNSQTKLTGKEIVIAKGIQNTNEFAEHCSNMARKIEEDEVTGSKRYVWIKTGADHFRHALNYSIIALSRDSKELRIL